MLIDGNWYWLASRCINTDSSKSDFRVCRVGGDIGASYLCYGYVSKLDEYTQGNYAVRPIVTLKSNVIDIDAGYDEASGGWKLK